MKFWVGEAEVGGEVTSLGLALVAAENTITGAPRYKPQKRNVNGPND